MRRHPAIYRRALVGVLLALFALMLVAPAAWAGKALTGVFGAPAGEGAGLVSRPLGIAVNTTGAGGVSPGDVYVVDSRNSRIDEFSASGLFVRAFGYDVVASGADNTGANERQSLTVDATGGSFSLVSKRKTFAEVTKGSNVVRVYAPTSAFHVGDVVQGGFPEGTTVTAVGTASLILSAAAEYTGTEGEFSATETTGQIPYNATGTELQVALESLGQIGAGNVSVTGEGARGTGPYEIEYTGALSHDDVFPGEANGIQEGGTLKAVSTALTGFAHTAEISTTAAGGGYEICDASVPSDVCKAAPACNRFESKDAKSCRATSTGGALNEPSGIAVDQSNGDLYVADVTENENVSNHRVNVYSATGDFEGAFGWDVNASSSKEELQFCTTATGCQYGSEGSGAGQFKTLARSAPALGPNGHLYVPQGSRAASEGGNQRVDEFAPVVNGSGEVTGVSFVGALGWDVVASGPDQADEVQKVTVRAGAGRFKLAFNASTTGELAFDAPAGEGEEVAGGPESVEKALNSLPSIDSGGGSVKVTGGPGGASSSAPYMVRFDGGPLAHADVAQMVATKVGLSGGSPTTVSSVETYSNGTEGLEYCVVARGDVCKAGTNGPGGGEERALRLGEFSRASPRSVAVDGSGALYAVNEPENTLFGPGRVYKFTFPGPGEVVAQEFAPEYLTRSGGDPLAIDATDVAVDPANQDLLVAVRDGMEASRFFEFDSAGALLDSFPAGETGLKTATDGFLFSGLAVGTGERAYFSNSAGGVDVLGPPPAPTAAIGAVTGVSASSAVFHGTVTPPALVEGKGFDTTYHFEYSPDGVSWSSIPVEDVDVGDGSGAGSPGSCPVNDPPSCEVSTEATGLVPGSHYQVRLVASTGTVAVSAVESFVTDPGAPVVSGTAVEEIGQTSARLTALVDPSNQDTTYRFEWGTDASYGHSVPLGGEGSAGSGSAPVAVNSVLEGLSPSVVYHYRFVASNGSGATDGPDREFVTLDRFGLPDGRASEQVSAVEKRPVGMVAQFSFSSEVQMAFQASIDGSGVLYPVEDGLADATAGGDVEYLGRRSQTGWQETQITPASLIPAVTGSNLSDSTGNLLYASADLSCEVIESFEPLTADTPAEDLARGIYNLYRRNADGTYTLLTAPVPPNDGHSSEEGYLHVDWASADCSHILFETEYELLAGAPSGVRSLYEWVEGSLRFAGVRPDEAAPGGESVASDAHAGRGYSRNTWNSVSADGSKVFFTAKSRAGADEGNPAVFVRENGAGTVDVSESQTATVDQAAVLALVSRDGSHVFFLANYGLATNGTSTGANGCSESGAGCDLYDYDTNTHTLTDLSVDTNPADAKGAGVVGVLDASDDGSYVYFAARGRLVPGKGNSEAKNLSGGGSYNVYAAHEGVLSFVGLISTADTTTHESGNDLSFEVSYWVADATPDGTHLLFVSKANITGYDSKGVTEAYLYSVANGTTVCVSCRSDGQPSVGTANTEPVTVNPRTSERVEPLLREFDRPLSVSDDGRRVFFTMPDVLAPGGVSGTRNLYEWEAGNVYLLVPGEEAEQDFTRLAGSSSTGSDVFVVTKRKLAKQDFDNTTDVYDLRAGGGFPEPGAPPAPCEPLSDACQGQPAPPLFKAPGPASEAFSGPGNPPPPRVVSCKKGLALVHGKCVSKPAPKHKKTVVRRCRKGMVRKHGKCAKKASVSSKTRTVTNRGRAGQ